jgi:hypothetical protein
MSDIGATNIGRDLIIDDREAGLQINEKHSKFMAMQYLILFPYGEEVQPKQINIITLCNLTLFMPFSYTRKTSLMTAATRGVSTSYY